MWVKRFAPRSKLILAYCAKCQDFLGASKARNNLLTARDTHRRFAQVEADKKPLPRIGATKLSDLRSATNPPNGLKRGSRGGSHVRPFVWRLRAANWRFYLALLGHLRLPLLLRRVLH
jgi:hypothetical protein